VLQSRWPFAGIVLLTALFSFWAGGQYWDDVIYELPRCELDHRVIDADTIDCDGRSIRLAGLHAPETLKREAGCPQEIELGRIATCELKSFLKQGPWRLNRKKKYGGHDRQLYSLFVNGRDAKDYLIQLKLAIASTDRNGKLLPKPNWCEKISKEPELLQIKCSGRNESLENPK
jgi:hypothetical protein